MTRAHWTAVRQYLRRETAIANASMDQVATPEARALFLGYGNAMRAVAARMSQIHSWQTGGHRHRRALRVAQATTARAGKQKTTRRAA